MSKENEQTTKGKKQEEPKAEYKINKYGFFGTTKEIRDVLKIPKGTDHPVEVKVDEKARSITLTVIGQAS